MAGAIETGCPSPHQTLWLQLDRTREEMTLLRWERGQTQRYLDHMQAALGAVVDAKRSAALDTLQLAARANTSISAARDAYTAAMQLHAEATLLERAAAVYKRMLAECISKFAALPS